MLDPKSDRLTLATPATSPEAPDLKKMIKNDLAVLGGDPVAML